MVGEVSNRMSVLASEQRIVGRGPAMRMHRCKAIDPRSLVDNALVAGTGQLWEWIGDGATTFSF